MTTNILEDKFKEISKEIWIKMTKKSDIQEPSLTDYVMEELNTTNSKYLLAINGKKEEVKGADIEWWIIYPGSDTHNPHAIHMRIQAKKLHIGNIGGNKDHEYKDLNHRNGEQMDNLINEARTDHAIPMYCFYNRYYKVNSKSYTKANDTMEEDGWRYAYADEIRSLRNNHPTNFKDLGIVDPKTRPMYLLARLARMNPSFILGEYIKLNKNINSKDLCNNTLPNYVFEALEAYQFPNHEFLKQGEWFPKISKTKKANKEARGRIEIEAMFKSTFEHVMNLLSFNKRKKRKNLIIVIAEEAINSEDRK